MAQSDNFCYLERTRELSYLCHRHGRRENNQNHPLFVILSPVLTGLMILDIKRKSLHILPISRNLYKS